jgi:carbon-monoxide dehydrogenase iron sulfur subunit
MAKVLCIDYKKCTGCRTCEQVCSVKHDGVLNPMRSRIKIIKWESEGLYVPISCNQCLDAPCMNVCPVKAISRNDEMERVLVDYDLCIGCRSCVAVCPFGAMSFNPFEQQVFKCDLCDGDPQCVRFCEVGALTYIDSEEVATEKKRLAAQKIYISGGDAAALLAQL